MELDLGLDDEADGRRRGDGRSVLSAGAGRRMRLFYCHRKRAGCCPDGRGKTNCPY